MNNWTGMGRLVRDPQITYTQGEKSTCIARYTLAVDRKFKREGQPTADYINCVAMGKAGEFVEKYFHKGIKVAVRGHIQTGSYTNKDGQKVYTTDVIIDDQEFCENKNASQSQEQLQEQPVEQASIQKPVDPREGFMRLDESITEELPFR